jgi:hypothetical protein
MRAMESRLTLALAIIISLMVPTAASAQTFTQYFPETGFSVSDTAQGKFLTEFRRFGGIDTLGYPISQPFAKEGFTYQTFQRAALQWRPEVGEAYLANSMDWLSGVGNDAYLAGLGIPPPEPGTPGLDFSQAVVERESWLTDPAIAQSYRSGGGMGRFGLPSGHPVQAGAFIVQRFQRYVLQHWVENLPGMPPPGSVVGVLAGDLLIKAGFVPSSATSKSPAPNPASWSVEAAGIALTVNSLNRTPLPGWMYTAKHGNTYLVLDVSIRNTGRDTVHYSSLDFKVRDAIGNEYEAIAGSGIDNALSNGDIAQGESVRGRVAIEVPNNVRVPMLLFQIDPNVGTISIALE